MTRISKRQTPSTALYCIVALAISASGCTSMKLPSLSLPLSGGLADESHYEGVDGSFHMQTSVGEQTYHAVRRARSENAIVLQVEGGDPPIRVLPLPPEGTTVYVSNLLKQSGAQQQLGFIEATLYRHSTDSIGGIPMVVKMSQDSRSVRPESDYALQAGDRLAVQKATNPALQGFLNTVMGL